MEDDDLCQAFLDSLVSLTNGSDLPQENHEFYKKHIETPLVIAIEDCCRTLYKKLMSEASISNYVKEAHKFLQRTECLTECCFLTIEKREVINKCEDVLVWGYAELMSANYHQRLFESNRPDELRHLYMLLARLPDAITSMQANYEQYLMQRIQAANAKLEAGPLDPKTYVDTLVTLYNENLNITTCCSDGDFDFSATMDRLFRAFANFNFVTESLSTKSSKLVVKYADMLLRQTVVGKDNMTAFDGIVSVPLPHSEFISPQYLQGHSLKIRK
jgi:cullin 1